MWPINSQNWIVGWIGHYLPWTLLIISLRSIIGSEWDLLQLDSGVWQGFAVISGWTGFIWLILILVLVIRYLSR